MYNCKIFKFTDIGVIDGFIPKNEPYFFHCVFGGSVHFNVYLSFCIIDDFIHDKNVLVE